MSSKFLNATFLASRAEREEILREKLGSIKAELIKLTVARSSAMSKARIMAAGEVKRKSRLSARKSNTKRQNLSVLCRRQEVVRQFLKPAGRRIRTG
jgi:hypothetical protein